MLVKVAVTGVVSLVTVPRTPLSTSNFASVAVQVTLFQAAVSGGRFNYLEACANRDAGNFLLSPIGMVMVIGCTLSALPKPIPPTLLKVTVNVVALSAVLRRAPVSFQLPAYRP